MDGAYSEWAERIVAAPLTFHDLAVTYTAPGVGEIIFALDGPLVVNSEPISLDGYRRFDNPYCQAEIGRGHDMIAHGDERLGIQF